MIWWIPSPTVRDPVAAWVRYIMGVCAVTPRWPVRIELGHETAEVAAAICGALSPHYVASTWTSPLGRWLRLIPRHGAQEPAPKDPDADEATGGDR